MIKRHLSEHYRSLKRKEYSSQELTKAYLDAIEKKDGMIGAYITLCAESAIERAKRFDEGKLCVDENSYIAGIPCSVKDNICTKGIKTSCASKMLENFVPPYDAFVVDKINASGAVILGKTNMDEFAMGASTESSALMVTRNPLDVTRVPGGSSGGAAASVAAYEAAFSIGSETGGSIRQPAAFCGVVGMKPTYGRVSRYGLVAYAPSFDQIGPITRTTLDNAMVLESIAGYDKRDSTSVDHTEKDFTSGIGNGVKGIKIGILRSFIKDDIDEDVKKSVLEAAEIYRNMGAEIVYVDLPSLEYSLPAYYILTCAEASSNLARFDGIRFGYRSEQYKNMSDLYKSSRSEGFGWEVKKRIMMGTMVLSEGWREDYYKNALKVRNLVIEDYKVAFKMCDVIIAPVAPTVAYKFGQADGSLKKYTDDIYTVSVNMAGLPALSIPCGIGEGNMPVGMQIIGPEFSEALLYRVGYSFEMCGKEDAQGAQ